MLKNVKKSKLIVDWIDDTTTSKNTIKSYRGQIVKFFIATGIKDIENYFNMERDYKEDFKNFGKYLYGKFAPKTQKTYLATVSSFLGYYSVTIDKGTWKKVNNRNGIKRARPMTAKRTLTNEDLRNILRHADIKKKALFMFSITTGMRIDEVLKITFDDITPEIRHVGVRAEIAKNNVSRDTFLSKEAYEYLDAWKTERYLMLKGKYKKSKYVREQLKKQGYDVKKFEEAKNKIIWKIYKDGKEVSKEELIEKEKRIFPFEYDNARKMWSSLVEKAGHPYNQIDKNTGRLIFHIHSLKGFWYNRMESAGVNKYHLDYMGAHDSELNRDYVPDFTIDELMESYRTGEGHIGIFTMMDVAESKLKPQIKEQKILINNLFDENKMLKQKIAGLEHSDNDRIVQKEKLEEEKDLEISLLKEDMATMKQMIDTLFETRKPIKH